MVQDDWDKLLQSAREVRNNAYVPYSHFAVGAALETEDGAIFSGCNVENVSFGLTNCAERSAVFHMVSAGQKKIRSVAVIADAPRPISPCGACRQVLAEFGREETPVVLSNLAGQTIRTTLGELIPYVFMKGDINERDE